MTTVLRRTHLCARNRLKIERVQLTGRVSLLRRMLSLEVLSNDFFLDLAMVHRFYRLSTVFPSSRSSSTFVDKIGGGVTRDLGIFLLVTPKNFNRRRSKMIHPPLIKSRAYAPNPCLLPVRHEIRWARPPGAWSELIIADIVRPATTARSRPC